MSIEEPKIEVIFEKEDDTAELSSYLRENKIPYSIRVFVTDSALSSTMHAISGWMFTPENLAMAQGAFGHWLLTRNKKCIKMKIGEEEFEATSIKEIEKLVKIAKKRATDATD